VHVWYLRGIGRGVTDEVVDSTGQTVLVKIPEGKLKQTNIISRNSDITMMADTNEEK
jgi:hypothetical protein